MMQLSCYSVSATVNDFVSKIHCTLNIYSLEKETLIQINQSTINAFGILLVTYD